MPSVEGSARAQTLLSIIHPLHPEHLSALRTFPSPQNVPARRCCCYTELTFPGSDLEQGANPHLSQWEHLAPPEAESESEEDVGRVMWANGRGWGRATVRRPSRGWGLAAAMSRLRSLSSWTAVWKDFLEGGYLYQDFMNGYERFYVCGRHIKGRRIDSIFSSWNY